MTSDIYVQISNSFKMQSVRHHHSQGQSCFKSRLKLISSKIDLFNSNLKTPLTKPIRLGLKTKPILGLDILVLHLDNGFQCQDSSNWLCQTWWGMFQILTFPYCWCLMSTIHYHTEACESVQVSTKRVSAILCKSQFWTAT